MLTHLLLMRLLAAMRDHYQLLRTRMARDDGYVSETVVITALLVILGATVAGIITYKVLARANSMDLEGGDAGV